MSKRKRSGASKIPQGGDQTAGDTAAAGDESAKEDMAHLSPDALSGSPDIFAAKSVAKAADAPEIAAEPDSQEPADEPVPATADEVEPAGAEPAGAEPASIEPALAPPTSQQNEAPAPAPYVSATPYPPRAPRGGSSAALGIVLVVVGLFALGVVLFGVDLTQYGWPLFVIIPGLTLLVVGFLGGGAGASVPGGIVTMLGLVLAYQSSSGDWPSWAFAWALVVPGGIGLGLYLQALRDRDPITLRRGRTLMFVAAMIFLIGFVLFESILGISGDVYGVFGKAALPGLLIIIGIVLLVRSMQRGRST
jgi:hypothetical protein